MIHVARQITAAGTSVEVSGAVDQKWLTGLANQTGSRNI